MRGKHVIRFLLSCCIHAEQASFFVRSSQTLYRVLLFGKLLNTLFKARESHVYAKIFWVPGKTILARGPGEISYTLGTRRIYLARGPGEKCPG
jgi:hypothetical protein